MIAGQAPSTGTQVLDIGRDQHSVGSLSQGNRSHSHTVRARHRCHRSGTHPGWLILATPGQHQWDEHCHCYEHPPCLHCLPNPDLSDHVVAFWRNTLTRFKLSHPGSFDLDSTVRKGALHTLGLVEVPESNPRVRQVLRVEFSRRSRRRRGGLVPGPHRTRLPGRLPDPVTLPEPTLTPEGFCQ